MERITQEWLAKTTANGVRTVAAMKSSDAEDQKYFKNEITETSKRISELQKVLQGATLDVTEKQLAANIGQLRSTYIGIRNDIIKVKSAGKDAEGEATD